MAVLLGLAQCGKQCKGRLCGQDRCSGMAQKEVRRRIVGCHAGCAVLMEGAIQTDFQNQVGNGVKGGLQLGLRGRHLTGSVDHQGFLSGPVFVEFYQQLGCIGQQQAAEQGQHRVKGKTRVGAPARNRSYRQRPCSIGHGQTV